MKRTALIVAMLAAVTSFRLFTPAEGLATTPLASNVESFNIAVLQAEHHIAPFLTSSVVFASRTYANHADYSIGKRIEVSIARQRLMAWQGKKLVMIYKISTGMRGYATPRGHYWVITKVRNGWSRKWKVVMPWMLVWHGNYGIHQVTHRRGSHRLIAVSQLGRRMSHGCIREPVGWATKLYRWAPVGTPVWIH